MVAVQDKRLQPCPFCGNQAVVLTDDDENGSYFFIKCTFCDVINEKLLHVDDIRTVPFDSKLEAIDAWNERREQTQEARHEQGAISGKKLQRQEIPGKELHHQTVDEIMDCIKEAGKRWITAKQIAELLFKKESTVRVILCEITKSDLIDKIERKRAGKEYVYRWRNVD